MGQHKSNPKAIAAKTGDIEPKKAPMSSRELERLMYDRMVKYMHDKVESQIFASFYGVSKTEVMK